MNHVLAVYGKDDILDYVRGSLMDEDKREIEMLVQSDPRAAHVVTQIRDLGDGRPVSSPCYRRLQRLQGLAHSSGLM